VRNLALYFGLHFGRAASGSEFLVDLFPSENSTTEVHNLGQGVALALDTWLSSHSLTAPALSVAASFGIRSPACYHYPH